MSNATAPNRLSTFLKLLTLYKPSKIAGNFRSMSNMLSFNPIRKSHQITSFDYAIKDLPTTFPYDEDMVNIEQFLCNHKTTGFIVVKDDKILYENYWLGNTEDSLCISWSMGKSIVSCLIGIAIDEGYIKDINVVVSDLVPLLKEGGYNGVTLKQVLQMTSGVHFDENYAKFFSDINKMGRIIALGGSLNDFAAHLKADKAPGTFNHYVSMDTQVLGMVLNAVIDKSLSQYLEEKVWQPLGMSSDAYWLLDSKGMELAFGGINATLRNYARFGQLYANFGQWQNKQIVPKQWVIDSITPDAPFLMPGKHPQSTSNLGYGYQWWLPEHQDDDFMAIGINGQYIYVNPKRRTVVVRTSADPNWKIGCSSDPMTQALCQYLAKVL